MHILDELQERGLVQDVTHPDELRALMTEGPVPFYVGYDPTSPTLHLGNLVQISLQARLQQAGHPPIVLVGGGTGMIGDPSGKSAERQLLDEATLARNAAAIEAELSRFLRFDDGPAAATMLNNAEWLGEMRLVDFLREVGKHLSVNYMTAKESVRARLEDREQGISYTEFSYMLLQALDFAHLARTQGCRLQVGGSDQWGNITAGIELARKTDGRRLFGLVTPLLLDASGAKMGKTAAGTQVWLDPDRTSPYAFYQHLLNTQDADLPTMLRTLSWRSLDEIEGLLASHDEAPHRRIGQRALAEDLTRWVHGDEALDRVVAASQVIFGGSLESLTDADLLPLLDDVPSSEVERSALDEGIELLGLLTEVALTKSRGAARRLLEQGGVYVNNVRVTDAAMALGPEHLGTETMVVLRAGKKSYHIVRTR